MNPRTLTSTSDSCIFRVTTVVICDVCTVCKVRFTSITLDVVQQNWSTSLSKVGTTKGSSYVGTLTLQLTYKPFLTWIISQLSTYNTSISWIPVVITDCTPCSTTAYLNTSLQAVCTTNKTNRPINASYILQINNLRTHTLTWRCWTSHSGIFIVSTVVIWGVCAVCKKLFGSITCNIIQ